jgi:hypothetical protein
VAKFAEIKVSKAHEIKYSIEIVIIVRFRDEFFSNEIRVQKIRHVWGNGYGFKTVLEYSLIKSCV